MNVAHVTLYREEETSVIVSKTLTEEVRGFNEILWSPTHVVFKMRDGTIIAYLATRVHEIITAFDE